MNAADRHKMREKSRLRKSALTLKNYCVIVEVGDETRGQCTYPDRLWFCDFSKKDESGGGCQFMWSREVIECTCEEAIADAMLNEKLENI